MRYRDVRNDGTRTQNILGNNATETTISYLMSSTNYSFEVAAVNSAGVGVYSPPIVAHTHQSKYGSYSLMPTPM